MADCASLERMCGGNSTEGSNPSLSAIVYGHWESIRVNYCPIIAHILMGVLNAQEVLGFISKREEIVRRLSNEIKEVKNKVDRLESAD